MNTVFLAVEDDLSAAVAHTLLRRICGATCMPTRLGKNRAGGSGQIEKYIKKYIDLARKEPVAVITDLDVHSCPVALIDKWFCSQKIPAGMAFRIAVREIEAWLMADRPGLSAFLDVSESLIPDNVEAIPAPKEKLISIARRAKREIRLEIVPPSGSRARQGLGYNSALSKFVTDSWNADNAKARSESLRRAITGFEKLRHAWCSGMAMTPGGSGESRKT